jgi:hypothetical protein
MLRNPGYSQRNTFAESAVQTTNTRIRTWAASSNGYGFVKRLVRAGSQCWDKFALECATLAARNEIEPQINQKAMAFISTEPENRQERI